MSKFSFIEVLYLGFQVGSGGGREAVLLGGGRLLPTDVQEEGGEDHRAGDSSSSSLLLVIIFIIIIIISCPHPVGGGKTRLRLSGATRGERGWSPTGRSSGSSRRTPVRGRVLRVAEAGSGFFFSCLHRLFPADYLGRLVFAAGSDGGGAPSRSTEFLGRAVLSLYDFGMGDREEHLLLMLMETALEEEVGDCVQYSGGFQEKSFTKFRFNYATTRTLAM